MSKSAEKSLNILKIVGFSDRPLGLLEISGLAKMDKSTTARLLATLETAGFVRRDPASRCYSPGPVLISLSSYAMGQVDLVTLARPDLVRLRDLTRETVSLHIRQQQFRVCVDGAESNQHIRRAVPWGGRVPLFAGPSGKAILAYLPDDDFNDIMMLAKESGTDMEKLSRSVTEIAKKGFALGIGDRTPNIGAVSVPLFDRDGIVGSLTIAGPAERWNIERMEAHVNELLETATELSALLGAHQTTFRNRGGRVDETISEG